jgi:protein-disulfide isomerase
MAKRQNRQSNRRSKGQRRPPVTAIGGLLLLVTVGVIFFLSRPPAAPDVTAERLNLDPVYGNPDAPVSIIKYASYGCRACQQMHNSGLLEHLVEDYGGQVNLIFRDFPYIMPAYDQAASEVAQCVLDQSNTAYWDFHDVLYRYYFANRSQDELVEIADTEIGGVDGDLLRACVDANTHIKTVQYDGARARELGVRGAPSLFIGEQRIFANSEASLRQAIEAELR